MPLFVDDIIIIYTENFKDSLKTLELTNELNNLQDIRPTYTKLFFYTPITSYQKVILRK